MSWLRQFWSRLCAIFTRNKLEAEMQAEIQQHLEVRTQRNIAAGMDPGEARYAAQREFGGVEQVREEVRDGFGWVWIEQTIQDIRFGGRQIRKSPGFAAIVIVTMALGIGATTAIFSIVNAVLLRPLPVRDADGLVIISYGNRQDSVPVIRMLERGGSMPLLAFERFKEQSKSFSTLFAFGILFRPHVQIDGQAEIVERAQFVSGEYYNGLGVDSAIGRLISPADDDPNGPPVAVISFRYWTDRFGQDPNVVGKVIIVNNRPITIVGVSQQNFLGASNVGTALDLSLPLSLQPLIRPGIPGPAIEQGRYWWLTIMGRLAPGVTVDAARAGLEPIFASSVRDIYATMRSPPAVEAIPPLEISPGRQGPNPTGDTNRQSLLIVLGLAGLVLLVACANVASMLLARGTSRQKEIATRLALGGSRMRLVRQLLVEVGLLIFMGGGLGLLVAGWAKNFIAAMNPLGERLVLDLDLDARVVGVAILISVLSGLLAGLVPALTATRLDLRSQFQGAGSRIAGSSVVKLGRALVIFQIALSVLLLIGAGLFTATLRNIEQIDSGFNRHRLLLFQIDAQPLGYRPERFGGLAEEISKKLENIAGVQAVAFSSVAVLSQTLNASAFHLSSASNDEPELSAAFNRVSPNFFSAMEIPVILGRVFDSRDRGGEGIVVNRAFAKKYFGNENPLGKYISANGLFTNVEIIAIVGDAKYLDLKEAMRPTFYRCFAQQPSAGANFAVRTAGDPALMISAIRQTVHEIAPALAIGSVRTQDDEIRIFSHRERLIGTVASVFGGVAAILTCIGLGGLMSFRVGQRTNEIGIRMALGALPRRILSMILSESLGLVLLGVVLGIGFAASGTRLISSLLFGISALDTSTYILVAAFLTIVTMLASLIPARRAAKVDPMVALRSE